MTTECHFKMKPLKIGWFALKIRYSALGVLYVLLLKLSAENLDVLKVVIFQLLQISPELVRLL